MALYIAEIEKPNGDQFKHEITAPNLEDATIEGTNYAESKGFEMLGIDPVSSQNKQYGKLVNFL